MKKYLLLFTLMLVVNPFLYAQSDALKFADEITLENVKKHVYTLSSPEMMGRNTGEKGQKDAAEYIASFYRNNQVDSLGYLSYFQDYEMYNYSFGRLNISYKNKTGTRDDRETINLNGPFYSSANIELNDTIPVYYLGYGKNLPEEDLHNKLIILLAEENLGKTNDNIANICKQCNANLFAVLLPKNGGWHFNVDKDKVADIKTVFPFAKLTSNLKNISLGYKLGEKSTRLNMIDEAMEPLEDKEVCILYAYDYSSTYLFNEKKTKKLYKEENKNIAGVDYQKYRLLVDSVYCDIDATKARLDTLDTENVIAFVEGTDKKEEVIVVSAHYDHIGAENDSTINYGADDNASGTAAVMEAARAMQKAVDNGYRPRRSVVFAAFSGEEMGLRGSHYYVLNSPTPLKSVVYNLNMDMVGRDKKNKDKYEKTVFMIANGDNKKAFKKTAKRLNKDNPNLKVSTHPGFFSKLIWSVSSDHYRFKRNHIPIACFFTGLHPDYHTPRDTPDKINYEKLTEITKLAYKTVWEMANSERDLKVDVEVPDKENLIERMMD